MVYHSGPIRASLKANEDTYNWLKCRLSVHGVLSPRWSIYMSFLASLGDHCRRGSRKMWGVRHSGRPGKNSVLWTRQACYTHKLTAAVVSCTRPVQDLANLDSTLPWTGKGIREPKPLAEELLTVADGWGRISQSSLRVCAWFLVSWQWACGGPPTQIGC